MAEGCKKRTIRYAKKAWQVLGPVLAPHVTAMVGVLEELGNDIPELITSNHDRRKIVISNTLKKAKAIGHDAFDDAKPLTIGMLESAVRAQIERSLDGIREGAAWMEIDNPADLSENLDV